MIFLLSPIGVNNASSNLLTARAPACPCVQYLELNAEGSIGEKASVD